ncbi:MAG: hypothetical protein HYX90_02385 [Chloroflexi bacterium]|nr:hypothetical protein [Chloroflexota bacterium]
MAIVPDASPLIALAKIEGIELLAKLYREVLITPWVWEEAVLVGKAMGARDAALIERAVRKLGFTRVKLKQAEKNLAEELRDIGTGTGEAEVLGVAKVRKALAVLDDKDARAAALALDISCVGTAGVLYEAFVSELIIYDELLELLEKLGKVAWISPQLLAGVIRKAREATGK